MKWSKMWPLVVLLLLAALSCKGTKSGEAFKEAKEQGIRAIPVAGAALLTYPLGPVYVALSVVGTALIVDLIDAKASLSSGETLTEFQLRKEAARYRELYQWAAREASMAREAGEWLRVTVQYALFLTIAGFLIWVHWRNRHNWMKLGYWRGVWIHGLFGGRAGVLE